MKLETGMYVRTANGKITKITAITPTESLSRTFYNEYTLENGIICSYGISKASFNIIDLIEVGDVVIHEWENGHKVAIIVNEFTRLEDLNIKSIVTKEQFENVEYKIGE